MEVSGGEKAGPFVPWPPSRTSPPSLLCCLSPPTFFSESRCRKYEGYMPRSMPFLSRVSRQRTVRPWGAGRSTNSRGSSTSTGGEGALSSFWVGAEGLSAPDHQLPRPQQVPVLRHRQPGRTTHRFLCAERTERLAGAGAASLEAGTPLPLATWQPSTAKLGGSGELCDLFLFCLACG